MENDWLYNKSSYGLLTTNLESSNLTGLVNFFDKKLTVWSFLNSSPVRIKGPPERVQPAIWYS